MENRTLVHLTMSLTALGCLLGTSHGLAQTGPTGLREIGGELALGGDGLAFALFLGGDAQIEGDRHAHTCVALRG